jgi:hypothetical protein
MTGGGAYRRRMRKFALLLLLLLSVPVAAEEVAKGTIAGVVSDSSGPIPGCTVTITAENFERTVISDAEGRFSAELPTGEYNVFYSLSGFFEERRDVAVAAGKLATADQALKVSAPAEVICAIRTCDDVAPESMFGMPLCSDVQLHDSLIEAAERNDRSAVALLRRRYDAADTYTERHRIGAALLRRIPNDREIWRELYEYAENGVRFAREDGEYSEELRAWCDARGYDISNYTGVTELALRHIATDPRALPLLLRALGSGDRVIAYEAIEGLGAQRKFDALPAIEKVLKAMQGKDDFIPFALYRFEDDKADELALRYLDEDERTNYLQIRGKLPVEEEEEERH